MKKINLLAIFIVCGVFFSGCTERSNQMIKNDLSELKMEAMERTGAKVSFTPNITFADLLESIKKDEKLDCKYLVKDEETFDEIEAHIYIEGEKYKSITYTTGGDTLYSIFDGGTFYSWSKRQGNGFKMSGACAEKFSEGEIDQESEEDFELDTYKTSSELFSEESLISCEETSYVDISIPSNIDFVDQCKMLEEQIEQIKQMQNNILMN